MTEQELLDKIKNRPSEFRIVFEQYYQMIFSYILRRTADFDLTRDVVSETFRKAFQHIPNFNYRGISIKVWLYRIATNELNLYFRYKKFIGRYIESRGFLDDSQYRRYIEEDRQNLEIELARHDQYARILDRLKKLPLKYQEVISLRFFESKNIREISEILDKKEGTVKSLISRGVEKLRSLCNDIE